MNAGNKDREIAPNLRELMAGYGRFNAWEAQEAAARLPQLSIEDGLAQFFQLCTLIHQLSPNTNIFASQDKDHWIQLLKARQQASRVMGHDGHSTGICTGWGVAIGGGYSG
jgi:hypothetical protein